MNILEMQDAIRAKGYQWVEHIYNDDNLNNCSIEFTLNTDPCYFSGNLHNGELGWGRFPREEAWRMAYERIVNGNITTQSTFM